MPHCSHKAVRAGADVNLRGVGESRDGTLENPLAAIVFGLACSFEEILGIFTSPAFPGHRFFVGSLQRDGHLEVLICERSKIQRCVIYSDGLLAALTGKK
jgi:hypothetical protein